MPPAFKAALMVRALPGMILQPLAFAVGPLTFVFTGFAIDFHGAFLKVIFSPALAVGTGLPGGPRRWRGHGSIGTGHEFCRCRADASGALPISWLQATRLWKAHACAAKAPRARRAIRGDHGHGLPLLGQCRAGPGSARRMLVGVVGVLRPRSQIPGACLRSPPASTCTVKKPRHRPACP